jgi:hypothetical protein
MKRPAFTALLCLMLIAASMYISHSTTFSAEESKPNELGKVLILEYHLIQPGSGEWVRTAEDFRRDLDLLYRTGYRSVTLSDYILGHIDIPAGTHPVIFTFDDSSPGQFRYIVQNGKKEIDPDCAVAMLMEFKRRHPDFGMHATFFVLPGAKEPHKLFGQPEFESEKLKELAALGFEIGNHTLWHANLKKYDAATVRKQLALAVQAIQTAVPGYEVHTLALPFGMYPTDPALAVSGSYNGISYHNDAILKVSGGPAPSPFSTHCDFLRLPRIQVTGKDLQIIISYFEKHPAELFTSDGKADTVTFPAGLKSEFQPARFKGLRSVTY